MFSDNGSSHQFWSKKKQLSTVIRYGHIDDTALNVDCEQVVVVVPCQDHGLDYYNNQFFKTQSDHLIGYILYQMSQDEASYKLKTHWGYTGKFDDTVPRWIMREWCSFWISDVLDQSYNSGEYNKIPATAQISTQDIFENWPQSFSQLALSLNLVVTVSIDTIKKQHENFLQVQKSHNIQFKCHQYVSDLLNNVDNELVLNSIFDEAYIQHLLRQHNLEIRCDGLDVFPSTTQQLKTLTYETI
jgi:hypothetical protein